MEHFFTHLLIQGFLSGTNEVYKLKKFPVIYIHYAMHVNFALMFISCWGSDPLVLLAQSQAHQFNMQNIQEQGQKVQ